MATETNRGASSFPSQHINITTLEYTPFTLRDSNGNWGGICIDILRELSRFLNITYSVMVPPDNAWGIEDDEGNFNGMIGQLQRQEVDIAVNVITISDSRHRVVDFSSPIFFDDYRFIMKKPRSTGSNYFIMPLSMPVWFGVLLSIFVCATIAVLMSSLRDRSLRPPATRERPKPTATPIGTHLSRLERFLWDQFRCLLMQSLPHMHHPPAIRIVLAWWWLFCVILAAVYTGNLTASLTARRITIPISSLAELEQSEYTLTFLKNSAIHGYFREAENEAVRRIYDKKIRHREDELETSTVESYRRALESPGVIASVPYKTFRYLHYYPAPYNESKCSYSVLDIASMWNVGAFALQKNSPYLEAVSLGLLYLTETGILEKIQTKYRGQMTCSGYERTEDVSVVTPAEVYGVFRLLGVGMAAAALVLALETIGRTNITSRLKHWLGYKSF